MIREEGQLKRMPPRQQARPCWPSGGCRRRTGSMGLTHPSRLPHLALLLLGAMQPVRSRRAGTLRLHQLESTAVAIVASRTIQFELRCLTFSPNDAVPKENYTWLAGHYLGLFDRGTYTELRHSDKSTEWILLPNHHKPYTADNLRRRRQGRPYLPTRHHSGRYWRYHHVPLLPR